MDLKQIYTYIIDKGNLFGIVCVVVLIVIRTLLSSKTVTDKRFESLLKFLGRFVIVSLLFIIVLKMINLFDGPIYNAKGIASTPPQNSTSEQKENIAVGKTFPITPRTFTISATTCLQFTRDGSLLVLQEENHKGERITTDTPIDEDLTMVSKIKIDDEDQSLKIYYGNAQSLPYEFDLATDFDERPFHSYLDRLQTAGYKVQYEHSEKGFLYFIKMLFLLIIGIIAIVIVIRVLYALIKLAYYEIFY